MLTSSSLPLQWRPSMAETPPPDSGVMPHFPLSHLVHLKAHLLLSHRPLLSPPNRRQAARIRAHRDAARFRPLVVGR